MKEVTLAELSSAIDFMAANPYVLPEKMPEDCMFNGHSVSFRNRVQYNQAIVDGCRSVQFACGTRMVIVDADGKVFSNPKDYFISVLLR